MNIAIFGASGFLGKRLSQHLLNATDWNIIGVARDTNKLSGIVHERFTTKQGNVLDYESCVSILKNVDVAYYFIHLMGQKGVDFYEKELEAAHIFAKAASDVGVTRIVYMGGLGNTAESTSKHLRARHETGEILRAGFSNTIELRASMIIGRGSVGYDIIRSVADKLPVMALPKSSGTKTQPIALQDALAYLHQAATVRIPHSIPVDIGGPDILSYADIYRAYLKFIDKSPRVYELPFIPLSLSGLFLNLFTPKVHARIGSIMAESMSTDMLVRSDAAKVYFPTIRPISIEKAFEKS